MFEKRHGVIYCRPFAEGRRSTSRRHRQAPNKAPALKRPGCDPCETVHVMHDNCCYRASLRRRLRSRGARRVHNAV